MFCFRSLVSQREQRLPYHQEAKNRGRFISLSWYILHLCPMFGFVQSSDLYTSFFIVAFPSLHHSLVCIRWHSTLSSRIERDLYWTSKVCFIKSPIKCVCSYTDCDSLVVDKVMRQGIDLLTTTVQRYWGEAVNIK